MGAATGAYAANIFFELTTPDTNKHRRAFPENARLRHAHDNVRNKKEANHGGAGVVTALATILLFGPALTAIRPFR
jgi:hypothetical protein